MFINKNVFLLLALLMIALISLCFKGQSEQIQHKSSLSMRRGVVTEQMVDLQSQRCFEALNKCQDTIIKFSYSLKPESERELTLIKENNLLRKQNTYYVNMINCLRNNDNLEKSKCLEKLSSGE